ncbi:MAG TPA: DUF4479 domain-containing protein [Bacillales bacterium]
MVSLVDLPRENQGFEKKGDAVRLFDKETKKTAGFNLFSISKYGSVEGNGVLETSEQVVDLINEVLKANGFSDKLSPDQTPDFVVGYVKDKEKHPDANKLSVCTVEAGHEELQIVCGAPNVEQGQKVVVARVGAVMPSGTLIKEANLRGIDSYGMICAARELDLPDAPQEKGILVLTDEYKVGEDFFRQYLMNKEKE